MPATTDTVRIPALRLLPPVTPDRRDKLRLTKRGESLLCVAGGISAAAAFIVGLNVLGAPGVFQ